VEKEIWLPSRFSGYEVSSLGRCRSVERTTRHGHHRKARILRPNLSSRYPRITPSVDNEVFSVGIHVLVCEAFHGPPPPGAWALHRDDNPLNNTPENLYWGTPSDNEYDKVRNGNSFRANRTHCPRRHQLKAPNLEVWSLDRGQRKCLACSRARSYVRNVLGGVGDLQAISDEYYEKLR
jgi:hypothetical protein